MSKYQAIRGMKDLYGIEYAKYEHIVNKAHSIAKQNGFSMISTPILEFTDVFTRAIGDETDVVSKEMYTFNDRGGESLTLRPEGTAGAIRAMVSEGLIQNLPIKVMYYGPMFRYDRPQKGRYRQFNQLGIEYVGDKDPCVDAIVIAMGYNIIQSLNIFDFKLAINSLGDKESRDEYCKAIVKYLSRYEKDLSDVSKVRLQKNPLRVLDSKDEKDKEICSMAPSITDYLNKDSVKYFEDVCRMLRVYGIPFDIDRFIIRGLDYYSHTAFEFITTNLGAQSAIGGGGRYDSLVAELGGPDVSGVGFALGMERLMLLMNDFKEQKQKKIAVVPISDEENEDCFALLKTLHDAGFTAELISSGNISKRMKKANKLQSSIALLIGDTEKENGTVTVKFMEEEDENNKTQIVNRSQIVQFLKTICC